MNISELKQRPEIKQEKKSHETFLQFKKLLNELRKKDLSDEIVMEINENIDEFNTFTDSGKAFRKSIRGRQAHIIRQLEKKLKIVPKNYYRNMWLAIGMSVFGIPLGVVFGISLDNMAFLAIGLPIGMTIGIGVGTSMDKKAFNEGRQLDIDIQN